MHTHTDNNGETMIHHCGCETYRDKNKVIQFKRIYTNIAIQYQNEEKEEK
jgi:hypothetical protein